MAKLLQISIEVNSGSVGRIAEQIGEAAIQRGWDSYITYARNHLPSASKTIKIGSKLDIYWHGAMTRLFDSHCLHSTHATKQLVKRIKEINPDVILLHHIHGYFLNMRVLFNYLSSLNKPIVWVFHDCWSFTGHCAYFDVVGCEKWRTGCFDCPAKSDYPSSMFRDRSRQNYIEKKSLFNSLKDLTIVPVSEWMASLVKDSFLGQHRVHTITNGININVFTPRDAETNIATRQKLNITPDCKIILGVASPWGERKGLGDFIKLSSLLADDWRIVLVGLSEKQLNGLPKNIIGLQRTENVQQLADIYAVADVFVNPTYADTYPTTNLEAISCGTPVVTYRTGGSPESVTNATGVVVEQGDIDGIIGAIHSLCEQNREALRSRCRSYAKSHFNRQHKFASYIDLFEELLHK